MNLTFRIFYVFCHKKFYTPSLHDIVFFVTSEEVLKRIGQMYAIEAGIRMPAEQNLAERGLKTQQRLKSPENCLREKVKTLFRHSALTMRLPML